MSCRKISISVPLESWVLKEAAAFLNRVATMGVTEDTGDAEAPPPVPITTEVADAVMVFNEDTPDAMEARIDEVVATTDPNSYGIELDAEGLPWDARIHSDSRKKLTKGDTWKLKRNIDKQLVENVRAELRAAFPPAAADTPIVPEVPAVPAVSEVLAANNGAPEVPALPAANVAGPPVTYQDIIDKVTERAVSGKLLPNELETILVKYGITDLSALGARPDKWAEVYSELTQLWV